MLDIYLHDAKSTVGKVDYVSLVIEDGVSREHITTSWAEELQF